MTLEATVRRKYQRRKEIEASEYQPDPDLARIAHERTRDIVRMWGARIAWGPADFAILAASCYMQGIHDALDAIEQRGLVIQEPKALDVWEGYCG